MQDLYGNPIGKAPEFALTIYQKRQAAILYHYASLGYLKGVIPMIDAVIDAYYGTSQTAQAQGRDAVLTSQRWGTRDTSANAQTYGVPFLSELRQNILEDIANRAFEVYDRTTGFQYAYGGLREISTDWMTDAEYKHYEMVKEEAFRYASNIDDTMDRQTGWDDSLLVNRWLESRGRFEPLPKFRVRTDVEAETGKKPLRTGVYVAQDDPNAALHFAWAGGDHGALGECNTFNDIGLDALREIGRADLWLDHTKMLHYVRNSRFTPVFKKDDWVFDRLDKNAELAWGLISENAFTTRPCKWYFVEMISSEFDDEAEVTSSAPTTSLRCDAGQPCPCEGWWDTPAKANSRRFFRQGEVMPDLKSDYGLTIWHWGQQQ